MATPIRGRDINQSVGKLRFDMDIVDANWSFKPSIGIVARDVDRFGLAIANQREPLIRSVKEVMIPSIRKNFQAEGRPAWEPLSPVTVKFRHGQTGPILQRTGRLQKAATSFNIWTITDKAATVMDLPANVWYGKLHQEGFGGFGSFMQASRAALGKGATFQEIVRHAFELLDQARGSATHHRKVMIPQRRFIMFQEDDLDEIQDIFAEWLETEARRAGRFVVRGAR